ncbi:MAG: radical SAM protein [Candidatus Brocadiia bacterium]
MIPIKARKLAIVEGVMDDPRMRARADRMRPAVLTDDVETVDDAGLARVVREAMPPRQRNGMRSEVQPLVVFNRMRFDDPPAEAARRHEAHPELKSHNLDGYDAFHWRDSGSPAYRRRTGLVCQPAWQLHTIVGCHFRCAYCSLSGCLNVMMNIEEFVERLEANLARCPEQTLFQYDNNTDTVCFEPAYGGARLLIDFFARTPGKALELYVGKSAHVDFLLDYDHRGHTVCCWSLAAETQSREIEWRTAPMAERIEAMARCQAAGYPVRVRFSPIVPVRGWEAEVAEMIERLFDAVEPDVVTIETIRFLDYAAMARDFDLELLDSDFVAAMRQAQGQPHAQGCEVPEPWRRRVYRFVFDQLERRSPHTPVAFCRELRTLWDHFEDVFARHNQNPDHYLCNCGPDSHPATLAPLVNAAAGEQEPPG